MLNKKNAAVFLVLWAALLFFTLSFTRFTVTGNFEGIFLLRGTHGKAFELKDDLFLGDGKRYIWGVNWDRCRHALPRLFTSSARQKPYLDYTWNQKMGDGCVRSFLSGDREMLFCFSRFEDDSGEAPLGLFVGGGLPSNVKEDSFVKANETGVAYHDGKRWYHLWCNTNEVLYTNRLESLFPSQWKFLGSSVLHHEGKGLVLESRHEVMVNDVPLRINRRAFFRAGDTYFILRIEIVNAGSRPATFSYVYGDEPWVGDYGTSEGNVGWAADGLHTREGILDADVNRYAGIFDYGNGEIGEPHEYSMIANFIEWFGDPAPIAYFSNGPYVPFRELREAKRPLQGNERFIGLLWVQRTLYPGHKQEYTLAIGMAGSDPKTGFPVKPEIDLSRYP